LDEFPENASRFSVSYAEVLAQGYVLHRSQMLPVVCTQVNASSSPPSSS
jgi:hypothetical protein